MKVEEDYDVVDLLRVAWGLAQRFGGPSSVMLDSGQKPTGPRGQTMIPDTWCLCKSISGNSRPIRIWLNSLYDNSGKFQLPTLDDRCRDYIDEAMANED